MKRFIFFVSLVSVVVSCSESKRFELLSSSSTGIVFNNEIIEKDSFNILQNEYIYNGGGVGVADLNNDGLQDLIFVGNKVTTRIYLNKGNFKFMDITDRFAGMNNSQWFGGVSVGDVNNDGLPDLYFASSMSKDSLMRKNRLWVNQGIDEDAIPSYTEQADQYGIADTGYSIHSGFFDYDLDGDLDLYVLNNIIDNLVPSNFRPKIMDGSSVNNDQLYQNQGNGTFKNVTTDAGIVYEGFGLGLAFGDINKDGYPDIYVSNDYISNDLVYINQKDGTFLNSADDVLSYQSRFSMGNDLSDFNNDGNLDVVTLDMNPESYARKKQTINGNSYYVYINDVKYGYQKQYVRNMLQVNNGVVDGKLAPMSEIGQLAGIHQTEWSWSPLFADFDNDGDKDLFITNGFPKDLTDKDFTNYKAKMHGYLANDEQVISKIPIVKVPNYAYKNNGNYDFENVTVDWGLNIPSFSNGAVFVDLDNDGDLDYVVNNINDEAFVYRNNSSQEKDNSNYLSLKLEGNSTNYLAIGSKIELWADGKYQYAEQYLTRGYISSVDPIVHFGLGDIQKVDSLKIIWPTLNKVTVLTNIQANQLLEIKEADAKKYIFNPNFNDSGYIFNEVDSLITFTHDQEDYNDFFVTPYVKPHKFSQIGPCMTSGDLNMDGLEDILIGASNSQPTSVYIQTANGFKNTDYPGLTSTKRCQEADLIIDDFDNDGDNDIIALSGGYTNSYDSSYNHYIYVNENGEFLKKKLPLPAFQASVVIAEDFDKDGDKDLFVGARVKRTEYPLSGLSYVLINNNGSYSVDAELSFDIGMVTDAVWSDYDNDGFKDLVVAREWNSITILKNEQGKSFSELNDSVIKSKHGFWSAINEIDVDNDGDMDYLVGNVGKNYRFALSEQFPLQLYAIDLDNNGALDPLISCFAKDAAGVMKEYPVNYLDELAAQSPYFRENFTSYEKFSTTTMQGIINTDSLPNNQKYYVNTVASQFLINDKGTFIWKEMPVEVQVAPVKVFLVKDFNGDNNLDVLIAGNDHSYDVSTGYFDANRGVLLQGDGKGGFKVVKSSESGIVLKGQVESLLYIDGPKPKVIAGINRDKLKVFEVSK